MMDDGGGAAAERALDRETFHLSGQGWLGHMLLASLHCSAQTCAAAMIDGLHQAKQAYGGGPSPLRPGPFIFSPPAESHVTVHCVCASACPPEACPPKIKTAHSFSAGRMLLDMS
uniref:Uncharacterized protein n=1 Tax=Knipowitschia caucasica TaxID=637954 RepID=A0AAV2LIS9_KNICA